MNHHQQPACQYASGYTPAPGDIVRLCTAQAVWRVRQLEPDGRVTVDPASCDGWTWRQPLTLTTNHLEVHAAPAAQLELFGARR